MALLALYNLIFIAPMLIITGAIYFGFTTTEKAERWRQGKLKILHLIAGLIILALGVGMFASIVLGIYNLIVQRRFFERVIFFGFQ